MFVVTKFRIRLLHLVAVEMVDPESGARMVRRFGKWVSKP